MQQKVQRLQQLLAQSQAQSQAQTPNQGQAQLIPLPQPTQNRAAVTGISPLPPTSLPGMQNLPPQIQSVADNRGLPVVQQQPQAATGVNQGIQESLEANASGGAEQSDMYDQAFNKVVTQLLPMSTDQIGRLKEAFNDAQRAAAAPVGVPPKPTSSSVLVDLAPQATPPVIRLQAGYITSMVFLDSTGQPWPIAAYSLGDPTAFNIQWDRKGNTLLVQSVTFYKRTNLAVILKGLNTPVMITLLPGQEAVDYRVDLRVPGLGPNAMYAQSSLPGGASPVLLDVLNGVPPRDSKTLKVSGGDCQAWYVNKTLYLRTNLDVISPAWRSIMTSIDGMHAYELQPAPVILVLEHGKDKTITLTLEGWE
ncbi:MAG: hypothetical protein A2X78_04115 [Gammaproteobacteria bacterium GWE2_37_16]|nr:MAG: hypothetical protein A2X78_04115 [Gammaproteobacteria bacterium GWE2_37_16]